MPDEHGRLLDELLELRSMAVAVQRSGEVIVRNHIFAISFSGLPHTVQHGDLCEDMAAERGGDHSGRMGSAAARGRGGVRLRRRKAHMQQHVEYRTDADGECDTSTRYIRTRE